MRKISFLLFCFISISIYSQTTLLGRVLESKSRQPVEYASVSVKGKNSTFFEGSIVDSLGRYVVHNLPKDTFDVIASYSGYLENIKTIVNSGEESIELDFFIDADITRLKEVSVSSMRSQVRFELDKKIFDVSASAISDGASATDILRDISSVEVSSDGNISLHGSQSVVVWINGKPSGLNSDNRAEMLEQLPAGSIDRVEVITNPSSKYSSEGTAGIINIILKKERKSGYYGSVQSNINTMLGYGLSGNINYSHKTIDIFASIGHNSRRMKMGNNIYRRMLKDGEDVGFSNSGQTTQNRGNNILSQFGLTYHITPKDDISFSAFGMFGRQKRNVDVVQYSILDKISTSQRQNDNISNMIATTLTAGYKHTFNKTSDIEFSLDYNLWSREANGSFFETESFDNNRDFVFDTTAYYLQKQNLFVRAQSFNLKTDYSNVFRDNHKIEVGYQGEFDRDYSPITVYSGSREDNLILNPLLGNRYMYDIYVNALYATYSGKFGNFSFQTGLRGEHTYLLMNSFGYEPIKKSYPKLFPSLFLSYAFPKEHQLQFSYTRRISRPDLMHLNPYRNISDSKNISFGNPNLMPEYSNALELNYIKTWRNHLLSFSGYFRNTEDKMEHISYIEDKIVYSTSDNISQSISTGGELVSKNKIAKFLNLTTTLNLYYHHLNGFEYKVPNSVTIVSSEPQQNLSFRLRMNAQVLLPFDIILQLSGGYNAPRVIAQGKTDASYGLDIGLKKSFGNFTLNLNGRDLLNSRVRNETLISDRFIQRHRDWRAGPVITLSVSYSFGNISPDRKKDSKNKPQNEPMGDETDF